MRDEFPTVGSKAHAAAERVVGIMLLVGLTAQKAPAAVTDLDRKDPKSSLQECDGDDSA